MATEVPKIAGATTMQIQSATAAFMDSIKDLRKNYELEVSERKRLFNLVQVSEGLGSGERDASKARATIHAAQTRD